MENSTATPSKSTTAPRKRRHSEYHDPDYGFGYDSPTSASKDTKRVKREQENEEDGEALNQQAERISPHRTGLNLDSVAQLKKFEEIVRAEFQRELTLKEQQLSEIDARLYQARQLLDKLRYHVVSEYYIKQQVPLTAADVSRVRSRDTLFGDGLEHAGAQLPLHPAVKKIVGKRPAPLQLNLPERTAATLAKQTIRLRNPANRRAERRRQQKIREQGIVTDHSQENKNDLNVTSCEEQPCTSRQAYKTQKEFDSSLSALNASRLNNKNKFFFVVGNTSKYLGGADSSVRNGQALAYKWLVYVQGKNLPQPPEAYLKKVRFQLHHSYRPNDIVDVHSPPFQLTRRGWGEFPMRIQLYFQEHLQQKPVQLMHTIVLDKTMCGLHTMGGETTVEVWLRSDAPATVDTIPPRIVKKELHTTAAKNAPSLLKNTSMPLTISITQQKEDLDDNLIAPVKNIELSDDIKQIEPTALVSESLKLNSPKKQPAELLGPSEAPLRLDSVNNSAAISPCLAVAYSSMNGNTSNKKPQAMVAQLRKGHTASQFKNVIFQKEGKLYIIDPQQSKLKQAAKQQSLLKPQLSLLKQPTQQLSKRWHVLQCIQNDHGYANMSSQEVPPPLAPPLSQRLTLEHLFCGIQFQNMRSAVEFLLRRLPLAGSSIKEFPFGTHSLTAFMAQPALRQRFFEFMRGRTLLRCMRQHLRLQHLHSSGKELFWSTREIVAFARLHGYTPPLKVLCVARKKASSAVLPLSERVQQQLQEDPQSQLLEYCSLTSRSRLDSWLTKKIISLQIREHRLDDEVLVDVQNLPPPSSRIQGHRNLFDNPLNHHMLYLPPPEELDAATQLVRDMCKDVGIVLHTEQSVPGVSQSLAITLLAHVLRMFIEKLVRRAVSAKLRQQQQPHAIETLPTAAANIELNLLPHDIARVIANSAELDFLGNSYLGVDHKEL
ncbi:uncharacterized protein LOC115763533 [Drosophila novamexicana]|uniref:uncharacterized protein LOC115763533 n=1 Tax=Drosophila novamexicana TaxID=47314 RepID=UPI0011E58F2A|nr:uncharacterized protein LOC115763533 [Drosophila novamexicana]